MVVAVVEVLVVMQTVYPVVLVVVVLIMDNLVELVVVFYSQDLLRLIHLLLVGVVMVQIMVVHNPVQEAVEPYKME